MTRVLQIRRGNTAQNNNFTGMTGEITYDTEAKTIRVHDGTTLGGVALARADQIPSMPTPFDITSVTDETWETIFARVSPAPFTIISSTELIVSSTDYIEYLFDNVATTPHIIRAFLVPQTTAAGYAANEETSAFGIGDYACPIFNTSIDSGGLHVRMAVGNQSFWVAHKSNGAKTDIINSEWRLKICIYC